MFGPAKHSYLAKIVSFKNPRQARTSAMQLWKEYEKAKTRQKKVRILKATQLAANRARATLNRKNLSGKERKEYSEIGRIYENLSDEFQVDIRKGDKEMEGEEE